MALVSLIVTALYAGVIASDASVACDAGPAYVGIVLAVWWLGRWLRKDERA